MACSLCGEKYWKLFICLESFLGGWEQVAWYRHTGISSLPAVRLLAGTDRGQHFYSENNQLVKAKEMELKAARILLSPLQFKTRVSKDRVY